MMSSLWAVQTYWIQHERQHEIRLPSSALAVASAVRIAGSAGYLNFSSCLDHGESKVQPSAEVLALCSEQVNECDKKLSDYNINLTIYLRTPECFGTDKLEFRKLDTVKHDLLLQFTSDAEPSLQQVEVFLARRRALELPDLNALVVPLAREMCLVGFLVAEKTVASTSRSEALGNSDEPVELIESVFSMEESRELVRLAQSLGLACVMEQRMALLRHVSWHKNVKIAGLLEQARGSLSALRTLGKMLLPQLKKGEISRDVLQDILVQSDHMKDVLDDIQEALYNTKDDQRNERSANWNRTYDKSLLKSSSDFTCETSIRDIEAPMPPFALAPQGDSVNSCVVADVISELAQIGGEMVSKKSVKLELRVEPGAQGLSAAMDEGALRQAVSRLLENAIQRASHAGGWIKTEVCEAPGGGILVVIEDFGVSTVPAQPMGDMAHVGLAQKLLESFGVVVRVTYPGAGRGVGSRVELWFPLGRGTIEASCACEVTDQKPLKGGPILFCSS